MATRRAVADGNWSATSTWDGGTSIPGNGDTVYSNGRNVTLDVDVNIGGANNPIVSAGSFVSGQWYEITSVGTTSFPGASSNTVGTLFLATGVGSGTGQARARATLTTVTNTSAGATTGGGGFTMSTAYTMTCDLRAGSTTALEITGSVTLTLSSLQIVGGTTTNARGLFYNANGTLTAENSTITGGSGAGSTGIVNNSTGSVVANSCVLNGGGSGNSISNLSTTGTCNISSSTFTPVTSGSPVVLNNSTGTITVSTSTINGGASANFPQGVQNATSGIVNISSSTLNPGTGGLGYAVSNALTGTLTISDSTFTAVNGVPAVNSTNANATNRFSGTFISSPNGTQPINAPRWFLNSSPTASYIQHALDGINANSFVRYYTADNALGQANPTDVRSGVSYASGALTGRLTVPARGTVANGVTVGPNMPFTATRSGTAATATLTYSYPYSVGNVITVTGASNNEWNMDYTIASVISGTSVTFTVPATHSATAGTGANMQTKGTAVLDGASVAAAVWGHASRTITGGTVDTLTNAPASVTPNDIWGYATRTLTSASGPTAADNATAVWRAATRTITGGVVTTLTNAPNVPTPSAIADEVWNRQASAITTTNSIGERVKNTATTAILGNLLAQANS